VSQALEDKTAPVRLVIAGEHGSGKSHRINLVRKEFLKARTEHMHTYKNTRCSRKVSAVLQKGR
jgi:chromosomal replication initiation ATPase DnaA